MINLLPPKQKEKVFNEKKQRIISTLMFFLIVFLLFASVTIYGTKHFGLQIINAQRDLFEQKKEKFSGLIEKEKDVQKLNRRLSRIDEFHKKKINLEEVFIDLNKIIPSKISLESFDYKFNESGQEPSHQIIIEGRASTWEDLLAFEEKLETNYSDVNFSEDSWSQVENINFLVKFNLNGEEK